MLTKQQQSALDFIRAQIIRNGHAPTLEEIGNHLGVRSRGYVHRIVQALIDKGQLVRGESGWRNIQLLEGEAQPTLPLLGRIAAGKPIEAIEDQESLNLAEFFMGPNRFALQVAGDSMVGIGILDGDMVIVERRETAGDGDIVVALINGEAATLKRLQHRPDGSIALIAENPAIPPMIYEAAQVQIQGILVGQLRRYR